MTVQFIDSTGLYKFSIYVKEMLKPTIYVQHVSKKCYLIYIENIVQNDYRNYYKFNRAYYVETY